MIGSGLQNKRKINKKSSVKHCAEAATYCDILQVNSDLANPGISAPLNNFPDSGMANFEIFLNPLAVT